MLAVIPQSFYRSLSARNLTAALIIIFAGAFSKSVCMAQHLRPSNAELDSATEHSYSGGKAFAYGQNLQDSLRYLNINRLMNAARNAFASPTVSAWALSNLAMIYKVQGRNEDAITLLEQALAIAGHAPGNNDYRQGAIANRLALYCGEAGRVADAEAYFNRAIAALEKSGDSASAAGALYNLAILYGGQHRYPEAADAALQSLSLLTKAEEVNQSRVFDVLSALGGIYYAQGRYDDAEQKLLQAFAIAQAFKSSDPRFSQVTANLAVIYKAEARAFEAIAMFSVALKASETALGPEDVWTGRIANRLAVTYLEEGNLAEAELLFKRAIAIGENNPAGENLFLAAALFNLSAVYTRQWRYEEAGALLQRSLVIRRNAYGPDHPAVEEVQNALAAVQGARQESRRSAHVAGGDFASPEAGER